MPLTTSVLRDSLETTAALARSWFEDRAEIKSRKEFEARGKLGDTGNGSVYVYFSPKGKAIYVGQTSRALKARLHDQTSPHKSKKWWDNWSYMRFTPLNCDVDRIVLEALLIAAYEPTANQAQKAKGINTLFPL